MTARAIDLEVPEHARSAWAELHAAITRAGKTPCAGADRDDWTANPRRQLRAADACLDCPAMIACARYADIANETTGVWGGATALQRAAAQKGAA